MRIFYMGIILVTALLLFAIGFMFAMSDTTPTTSPAASAPRQARVTLAGSVSALAGVPLPLEFNPQARSLQYIRLQEPTDLGVELPGNEGFQMRVKYASFAVERGTVVDVNMLPLMQSVPYKQAVAELRRRIRDMGLTPDERMQKQMALWPEDSPGFDPVKRPGFYPANYRAGMKFPDDLDLDVKLRPADDGGWFIVITFAVSGETRRRIAGLPALQATTQPTDTSDPEAEKP